MHPWQRPEETSKGSVNSPSTDTLNLHTLMEVFDVLKFSIFGGMPILSRRFHMRGRLMVSKAFTRSTNVMWSC